ncbi:MAG: hypothetical protein AAFR65_06845 [Pseudomonadota bacterium]
MRDGTVRLAIVFSGLSLIALFLAGVPKELLVLRAGDLAEPAPAIASDLPLMLAAGLHHGMNLGDRAALLIVSITGWLIGTLILTKIPRTRKDAVLMLHPGSILMVAAGAGLGAFGLITLFASIRHAAMSRAMADLPVVGLAMALAALTVPEFERLVLPLASVLFLTAPPAMLQRQIFSYYLIVFLPALTILALAAGFGREFLGRSAPVFTGPNLAIAAIALPSLLWAAVAKQTRRLALALFILFVAMSLAGRDGFDWPVLAAAIAGASAIRGRFGPLPEVIGAFAAVLIVAFLAMGLTGPGSWS